MLTTPPATLLITGLITSRKPGRSRGCTPGETQALYVSRAFDACASDSTPLLTVMPVRSGQGVQGTTP
jgi:hypothetical protein